MTRWRSLLLFSALILALVFLSLGLLSTVTDMRSTMTADRDEYRDNVMFFASRFERELLDVVVVTQQYHQGDSSISHDDVINKFDVFWSRVSSVDDGPLGKFLKTITEMPNLGSNTISLLQRLEPLVLNGEERNITTARSIVEPLLKKLKAFHGVSLATSSYMNSEHSNMRTRVAAWVDKEMQIFAGLIITGSLLILMFIISIANSNKQLRLTRIAQQETEAARAAALVASEAKTNFLANMSHELRTPLNAIIGFSDIQCQQMFGPLGHEKYLEYANDINSTATHLLELITDVLDVAAIEAGKMELSRKEVGVREVMQASVKFVAERSHTKGIQLTEKIDDSLPLLYADELRTKQILINLLTNAVKYTKEGGEITISSNSADDGGIIFIIADNGIGMNNLEIMEALSKFGRVRNDINLSAEGTGLGLPLCKHLVEMHNGTFDLASETEIGTTIRLYFPPKSNSDATLPAIRRWQRFPLSLPVTFVVQGKKYFGETTDISAGGAAISIDFEDLPESSVDVLVEGLGQVEARICRRSNTGIAVEFIQQENDSLKFNEMLVENLINSPAHVLKTEKPILGQLAALN